MWCITLWCIIICGIIHHICVINHVIMYTTIMSYESWYVHHMTIMYVSKSVIFISSSKIMPPGHMYTNIYWCILCHTWCLHDTMYCHYSHVQDTILHHKTCTWCHHTRSHIYYIVYTIWWTCYHDMTLMVSWHTCHDTLYDHMTPHMYDVCTLHMIPYYNHYCHVYHVQLM